MRALRQYLLVLLLLATQQAGLLHVHAYAGGAVGQTMAADGDETPNEPDARVCTDCVAFAGTVPAPPAKPGAFSAGAFRQVHQCGAVTPRPTFSSPAAYRSRAPPAFPI